MNLKDEMRKIIELQELDSKLYAVIQNKDFQKPALLERIKKEAEAQKQTVISFEDSVKQVQLRKKEKELDLASREESVRKAQAQLYQLKTNKEYQAKLSEIESLKADISVLEEAVISVLDELADAEKALGETKNKVAQEDKVFTEKIGVIEKEIKDLEVGAQQLRDKKSILEKEVDPNILSVYNRLIATRGGSAIVPVKNGNCGACHMAVTAQTINEIKMYKDLVFCGMCVRILYIEDDFSLKG